jgi:RNA polymerase sigma factor (sigma-70 family)
MNNHTLTPTFNAEITRAYKPLTKEEEIEMILRAQNGDINARNAIVNSQLKKLIELARGYVSRNGNNDISQLMAIGISGYQGKNGLIEAIEQFDVTRGMRFITFAFQFMKNPMRDFSVDNRPIRVPRNLSKSNPLDPELVEKYSYEAEMYGMTLDEYIEYRNSKCDGAPISLRSDALVINTPSLDTPLNSGDKGSETSLGDMLSDDSIDLEHSIVMGELDNALSTLTKEESAFINEYYFQDATYQEMADDRHISKQAVHTRIEKIKAKLNKRYGKVKG